MRYSPEDAERIEADGERIEIDRLYLTARSNIDGFLKKNDDRMYETHYTLSGTTTSDCEKSLLLMTEAVKKLVSHYSKEGYNVVSYPRSEQGKVVVDIVVSEK